MALYGSKRLAAPKASEEELGTARELIAESILFSVDRSTSGGSALSAEAGYVEGRTAAKFDGSLIGHTRSALCETKDFCLYPLLGHSM